MATNDVESTVTIECTPKFLELLRAINGLPADAIIDDEIVKKFIVEHLQGLQDSNLD